MAEDHEKSQEFNVKKKVDESWKGSVDKDKDTPTPEKAETSMPTPDPSFPFFISMLGMQAIVALGDLPDPATKEKKCDLTHARYLIDIIKMLSEKTKGNLSEEEGGMLHDLLYELQIKFVEKSKTP